MILKQPHWFVVVVAAAVVVSVVVAIGDFVVAVVVTVAAVDIFAFVAIVFMVTVVVVVSCAHLKESASHPFQLSLQLDASGTTFRYEFEDQAVLFSASDLVQTARILSEKVESLGVKSAENDNF